MSLTKWRKNCSQSVECHDFLSKPRLIPLKCPALGWEGLAQGLPQEPRPEPVTSFGTSGAVFSTLFLLQPHSPQNNKRIKKTSASLWAEAMSTLTYAWLFAAAKMEESQEVVQWAVALVGEEGGDTGLPLLTGLRIDFSLHSYVPSPALPPAPQFLATL